MKSVYRSIADNWIMIESEEEKEILVRYFEKGRTITIVYTVYLISSTFAFITLPVIPLILNKINPLPEPRPYMYIFQSEFLIFDKDAHYLKVYIWDVLSMFTIIIAPIGCDTMYAVVVEHCLALYSIVKHRLLQLKNMANQNSHGGQDNSYKWLVDTIKLHQVALSFTDSIEQSYSLCFFVLAIEHLIVLPLFCVLIVIYFQDNPMNAFRFVLFFTGLLVHLFMIFWPGQKIINHSTILMEYAYDNEWYETAGKTKKILCLFMLKCLKPSLLSAGGLILLNFANYLTIVKTAVSYITVFASFRQN